RGGPAHRPDLPLLPAGRGEAPPTHLLWHHAPLHDLPRMAALPASALRPRRGRAARGRTTPYAPAAAPPAARVLDRSPPALAQLAGRAGRQERRRPAPPRLARLGQVPSLSQIDDLGDGVARHVDAARVGPLRVERDEEEALAGFVRLAMSLDAASVREGDAHGLPGPRLRLLSGREHEEDRLHLVVFDGHGRSAALRLQRDLPLRQIEIGHR